MAMKVNLSHTKVGFPIILALALILVSALSSNSEQNPMRAPLEMNEMTGTRFTLTRSEPQTSAAIVLDIMVFLYQRIISPIDGSNCQMAPVCSLYARQALSRWGFPLGYWMACDRLCRCNGDAYLYYPKVYLEGNMHLWDPVPEVLFVGR